MSDSSVAIQMSGSGSQTNLPMAEIERQRKTSQQLSHFRAEQSQRISAIHTRRQIEAMKMNVDRALANEASSRVLQIVFGKFSLIQKIMQNMG